MGILTRVRTRQRYVAMLGLALLTGGCNLVPFDEDLVFASLFARDLDQVGSLRIEDWDRFDGDDPVEPIAFFPDYLYLDGGQTRSLARGYLVSKINQQLEFQYLDSSLGLSQTISTNINSSAGALGFQLFHIPLSNQERQAAIGLALAEPASGLLLLKGDGREPDTEFVFYTRDFNVLTTDNSEIEAPLLTLIAGLPPAGGETPVANEFTLRGFHINVVPANWVAPLDGNVTRAFPLVLFSFLSTGDNGGLNVLSETIVALPGSRLLTSAFDGTEPLLDPPTTWVNRRLSGPVIVGARIPPQSSGSSTEAQNIAFAPALIADRSSTYAFTTGFSSNNDLVTYSWDPIGTGADYGEVSGELAPSYRRVDGTVFDGRTGSVRTGQVGGAKSTRELGSLYYLGEYLTPDETAIRDLYSNVRAVRRNGDTALEIDIYADAITTSAP